MNAQGGRLVCAPIIDGKANYQNVGITAYASQHTVNFAVL